MNVKKIHLPVALAACVILLTGWTSSREDIRKAADKITTLSARFSQIKKMQILAKPLISTGSFYFKAPDSVRWEYDAPVKNILLFYQGKVRRYRPASRGFNEDAGAAIQSMNVMMQEITLWSKGRFSESRSFSSELMAGDPPKIILRPRESGLAKIIASIEITLAPDRPGVITCINVNEGEGNTTTFQFNDVKINGELEDSLFRDPG